MTRRVPISGVIPLPVLTPAERALRAAMHEATPRLIGCACGRQHVEDRDKSFVDAQGTVHRYGRPCYRVESEP
jgi:hypothetical protein